MILQLASSDWSFRTVFVFLAQERSLRESTEGRRSAEIGELLTAKDLGNQLQLEITNLKDQLAHEQERSKHYLDQVRAPPMALSA